MPLYSYRCPSCHARDERNVPIDERNHQFCFKCDHQLRKLISPGLQVCIPVGFQTSFSDVGPRSDQAKKLWKDRAVYSGNDDF